MNLATIGTGMITSWFLTCWKETGNACYAVYSRSIEKGENLRQKFAAQRVYTELDALLADQKVEVVYIASVNSLHFLHAKKALLAKKHVLLEKPFTSTQEECQELIALAKKQQVILMEAITTCDLPHLSIIKKELHRIAPIHMVTCNMSKVSSKYEAFMRGEQPNVFTTKYSGGALVDLNVYNLHFMIALFGMPKHSRYHARKVQGIDVAGTLILEYEDKMGVCIAAKDSDANSFVEVQGENGVLRIESDAATCTALRIQPHDEEERYYHEQTHTLTHYYYLLAFLSMVETSDFKQRDERLAHTLNVITLLEKSRKQEQLYFEADL